MATAVQHAPHTNGNDVAGHKASRSLKWRTKLFRKKDDAVHDIVLGAQGGVPPTGANPNPEVEERDTIQHVAGTGTVVNDPADPASNRDTEQEKHVQAGNEDKGVGTSAQSSSSPQLPTSNGKLSPRQEEKRAANGADGDATAGAGGLSDRRGSDGSVNVDDDDDDKGDDEDATPEQDSIAFYHRDQPYFWLSNASEHPIYLDGQRYATAEHLFQSLKFLPHRVDLATKVRKATSPSDAMLEARKHIAHVQKGWIAQGHNVAAMRTVLLLKFSQHSNLRRQLLHTGDADLIEDSPIDAFWGLASRSAGGVGAGRNELGKALVRTRETIRNQAGLGYGSAAKTV